MGRRHQKVWVIGAFILLSLAGDRVFDGEFARGPDLAFNLQKFIPGESIRRVRYVSRQETAQASLFAFSGRQAAGLSTDTPPQAAPARDFLSASARPHAERQAILSAGRPSLVEIRSPFVERASISEKETRPAVHVLTRPHSSAGISAGESAEENTIPLAILVAGLGEDPWVNTLSLAEENPFTHVLHSAGTQAEASVTTLSGENSSTTGTNGSTSTLVNQGATPPTGDILGPSVDTGAEIAVSSGETRPEVVLFLTSAGGGVTAVRAAYEGGRSFQISQSSSMEIDYISFDGNRSCSDYYIFSDFNEDGLGDLLRTSKFSGIYQLFLNNGHSWTPMLSAKLPFRPAFGTWLALLSRSYNQLLLYNADNRKLELLQCSGDGAFQMISSFSLPGDYDGVVGVDFTQDGFDDLVLQNLGLNRVNYLANADGYGFRPLASSAPRFPDPVLGSFHAWPNMREAKYWLCQYGNQNFVYLFDRLGRPQPVLLFEDPGVGTCLILADFDQNGSLDIGVGHIVR